MTIPVSGKEILSAVIDHVRDNGAPSAEEWGFSGGWKDLGMYQVSSDGSKFWLHFNREGFITVMWRPKGSEAKMICEFEATKIAEKG